MPKKSPPGTAAPISVRPKPEEAERPTVKVVARQSDSAAPVCDCGTKTVASSSQKKTYYKCPNPECGTTHHAGRPVVDFPKPFCQQCHAAYMELTEKRHHTANDIAFLCPDCGFFMRLPRPICARSSPDPSRGDPEIVSTEFSRPPIDDDNSL